MNTSTKQATLHRTVMATHTCPHGIKAKDLLQRNGYLVDDQHLTTPEQTSAFREAHGVTTTPQAWINGERIGGYDDLRAFFGNPVAAKDQTSYRPVITLFAVAAAMAFALSWISFSAIQPLPIFKWFVALSMCLLALQKLQDVDKFSSMFLGYDLLAQRWVRYAYIYPYLELLAGVLMLAGALVWLAAPVALVIGGIGAISIYQAVYIEKRELKCACVGGDSNVPLGFVSLTESLMMVGMGVWMLVQA